MRALSFIIFISAILLFYPLFALPGAIKNYLFVFLSFLIFASALYMHFKLKAAQNDSSSCTDYRPSEPQSDASEQESEEKTDGSDYLPEDEKKEKERGDKEKEDESL